MSRRYKYGSVGGDILVGLVKIPFILGTLFGTLIVRLFKTLSQSRARTHQTFKIQTEYAEMGGNEIPSYTHSDSITEYADTNPNERYTLKQSLLTDAEKEFLEVLQEVVGDKYRIKTQVPLSGIVKPLDSRGHYTNYHDFNKIKAKSIDFVLCDKELEPHLAIELDDRTHLQPDRVKRDNFLDSVMNGVGLPIIHIPVSYTYDLEELRTQIFGSTD